MNVSFTVRFRGVSAKAKAPLERMLSDDMASYPSRLAMKSATVEMGSGCDKKGKEDAKS